MIQKYCSQNTTHLVAPISNCFIDFVYLDLLRLLDPDLPRSELPLRPLPLELLLSLLEDFLSRESDLSLLDDLLSRESDLDLDLLSRDLDLRRS